MTIIGQKNPAITVIIPAYNCHNKLPACIDALFFQNFTDFEIILVDDASTDGTKDYCEHLAGHYKNICCLSQARNAGQGLARNAGLAAAKGEYILFVDADDTMHSTMLSSLFHAAQKSAADMVICGYTESSDTKERSVLPAPHYTPRALLQDRRLVGAPWNKLFRRSFLQKNVITFPHCRFAEDTAFVCKALACNPVIQSCPVALYNYSMHVGNTSHSLSQRCEVFIALEDIRQFLHTRGVYAQYRTIYWKIIGNYTLRYPLYLLLVASLWQGKKRRENLRAVPQYLKALATFLYRHIKG